MTALGMDVGPVMLNTGGEDTVKLTPGDVTPPEDTAIVAVPEVAIRLAGTEAVSCVALTNVVVSGVPFQSTTAVEANPLPFTVNVNPGPPAVTLDGLTEVMETC